MLETYVKRLEDLERVALSFGGISKSYAIQAGREIRLIVESEKVNADQGFPANGPRAPLSRSGQLQGWEQGRKQPSGAARTLLTIARTNPKALQ